MSSPRGPRRHLTYANVMSTLAVVLLVAVGGTAAAGTVAKTVAKNTVTSKSIKDNTVTTKDVKDGSLGRSRRHGQLADRWPTSTSPS